MWSMIYVVDGCLVAWDIQVADSTTCDHVPDEHTLKILEVETSSRSQTSALELKVANMIQNATAHFTDLLIYF